MAKKKKVKLKKQFKILLWAVVLIIVALFVIKSIHDDYVYKNSYSYKLQIHGYDEKETKILIKELNEKKLEEILKSPKDDTILNFISEKYYLKKNLERYLAYYEKHKKLSYEEIVRYVNVNADYEYYEHDIDADISKGSLIICNKYYKLSSDYEPDNIVNVNNKYYYGQQQRITSETNDAFIEMWQAANEEGIYLIINSSYRTFQEQEEVFNEYKDSYGEREADSIASRPGHSEHQTGLAIDVFSKDNTTRATFKESNAYKWLLDNSYKYGFILRYPEGKEDITGYAFESWHYRYVGSKVAKEIHDKNITFDEYYAYYLDK